MGKCWLTTIYLLVFACAQSLPHFLVRHFLSIRSENILCKNPLRWRRHLLETRRCCSLNRFTMWRLRNVVQSILMSICARRTRRKLLSDRPLKHSLRPRLRAIAPRYPAFDTHTQSTQATLKYTSLSSDMEVHTLLAPTSPSVSTSINHGNV